MRTRTHEIKVRLNDEEYAHLTDMVSRSIYSREVFLRTLLNGYILQECPKDYRQFSQEIMNLGSELRLFQWNKSLSPAEKENLIRLSEKIWDISDMLTAVYFPYYKEKTSKYKLPI